MPLAAAVPQASLTAAAGPELITEIQRRAFQYFVEKSDVVTGLTQDRAENDGSGESQVASLAATGYALAAWPVGVERGWIDRAAAEERALRTLKFLQASLPEQNGFFYHFVNKSSGARAWNCEVSSLDSALLFCGALISGQYFGGETQRVADAVFERANWQWVLTNGGAQPDKLVVSHGWTPESGFIGYDYGGYSEAVLVYLLGLGSSSHPLPPNTWKHVMRSVIRYGETEVIAGGPIFMHQMPHNFFALRDRRDGCGFDYWVSSTNATLVARAFCMDHMKQRRSYGPNFWSLNASDGPDGYQAYGALGMEDGTISPTGAIASIPFTPELSIEAATAIYRDFGQRLWGRYGFGNAYNVDRDWYGSQVIGIDLGMALLAIENHRSGLLWRLLESHDVTKRAYAAAGFVATTESGPRALTVR